MAMTMISTSENRGWCAIFGIEAGLIIIANLLVIAVFAITRSLRHKTYYLLISLAVADFLVGAVAVPMYVHLIGGLVSNFWLVHTHISFAQRSMEIFTSFASIFFLAAIALERCYAVLFPVSYTNTRSLAYFCVIGFIWFMSALLGILSLLREGHVGVADGDDIFIVLMFFLILTIVIVVACYLVIFIVVIRSHKLDDSTSAEVQLALTLFILSIVFIVTWSPFTIINFIFQSNPTTSLSCGQGNLACLYHAIYFSKLLHYLNSLINPFIYAWRMLDFRRSAQRLLCCCCYDAKPDPAPAPEVSGYDNQAVNMDSIATSVPSMFL